MTIASYFYRYHSPPAHPALLSNFDGLDAFGRYLVYVAKYIGGPVAFYDPGFAAIAGCIGIVLFAWLTFTNRDLFGSPLMTFLMSTVCNASRSP